MRGEKLRTSELWVLGLQELGRSPPLSYAGAMDGYRTQALDVSPDVERVVIEGWRSMSAAEKVQQVCELTDTARKFALAGIRRRHPDASEHEVRLRLASFWLDRDTMVQLFDWDPERDPTQGS